MKPRDLQSREVSSIVPGDTVLGHTLDQLISSTQKMSLARVVGQCPYNGKHGLASYSGIDRLCFCHGFFR